MRWALWTASAWRRFFARRGAARTTRSASGTTTRSSARRFNVTSSPPPIGGVPVSDMVRDVRERMGVGTSDATRLVRTELNYVQNQAALDSIKDAGVTYYRFIATLDNRTTPLCRSKDGEVFAVDDAEPGTNMPPLHPRCRSIISGSLYAEHKPRKGTRIARDEHGKNVFVPAGMRYGNGKGFISTRSRR